jgi:hypothetical protein
MDKGTDKFRVGGTVAPSRTSTPRISEMAALSCFSANFATRKLLTMRVCQSIPTLAGGVPINSQRLKTFAFPPPIRASSCLLVVGGNRPMDRKSPNHPGLCTVTNRTKTFYWNRGMTAFRLKASFYLVV